MASWFPGSMQRASSINISSLTMGRRSSIHTTPKEVEAFKKKVSSITKEERPDNCILYYMKHFDAVPQEKLQAYGIQGDVARLVRHIWSFMDIYLDDENLTALIYQFLNSMLRIYTSATRTDQSFFKIVVKTAQSNNSDIIEAATPFIQNCLMKPELQRLFFNGPQLASIWTNIFIKNIHACCYLGPIFCNSAQNYSVSDATVLEPMLNKVIEDLNENMIDPTYASTAFSFLGYIIRTTNTADFLPSILETVRNMSINLDNLSFLEPFILAPTSDPPAIWAAIDSIFADPDLPIELMESALIAIHNTKVPPSTEVFSFNSFIPRMLELSDNLQKMLFDVISQSETETKADFFCYVMPLSQSGINTSYLEKISSGIIWGNHLIDLIIQKFFIEPGIEEIRLCIVSDNHVFNIASGFISQISNNSVYINQLFNIFTSLILEGDLVIKPLLITLMIRSKPELYMKELIEQILTLDIKDEEADENYDDSGEVNTGKELIRIYSQICLRVLNFTEIFVQEKGTEIIPVLFESFCGIDFLSALVVDGPIQEIDDFIYDYYFVQKVTTFPPNLLSKRENLFKLMNGLPITDSKKRHGFMRLPSMCAYISNAQLDTPIDQYIYGSTGTRYFTASDEQISKFAVRFMSKELAAKIYRDPYILPSVTDPLFHHFDLVEFHPAARKCSLTAERSSSTSFWFNIIHAWRQSALATFPGGSLLVEENGYVTFAARSVYITAKAWHMCTFVTIDKQSTSNSNSSINSNNSNSNFQCPADRRLQIIVAYIDGEKVGELNLCNVLPSNVQSQTNSNSNENQSTSYYIDHSSNNSNFNNGMTITFGTDDPEMSVCCWLMVPYLHNYSYHQMEQSEIKRLFEQGPQNPSPFQITASSVQCAKSGVRFVPYRGILKYMNLFGGPFFIFNVLLETDNEEHFLLLLQSAFNLYRLNCFTRNQFASCVRYVLRCKTMFITPLTEQMLTHEFEDKGEFDWNMFRNIINDFWILTAPQVKYRIVLKALNQFGLYLDDFSFFHNALDVFVFFSFKNDSGANEDDEKIFDSNLAQNETVKNIIGILKKYIFSIPTTASSPNGKNNLAIQQSLIKKIAMTVASLPFFDDDEPRSEFIDERVIERQRILLEEILFKDIKLFQNIFNCQQSFSFMAIVGNGVCIDVLHFISLICIENNEYFDLLCLKHTVPLLFLNVRNIKLWISLLQFLTKKEGKEIEDFLMLVDLSMARQSILPIMFDLLTSLIPYEIHDYSSDKISFRVLHFLYSLLMANMPNISLFNLIANVQNICSLGYGERQISQYPFPLLTKKSALNTNRRASRPRVYKQNIDDYGECLTNSTSFANMNSLVDLDPNFFEETVAYMENNSVKLDQFFEYSIPSNSFQNENSLTTPSLSNSNLISTNVNGNNNNNNNSTLTSSNRRHSDILNSLSAPSPLLASSSSSNSNVFEDNFLKMFLTPIADLVALIASKTLAEVGNDVSTFKKCLGPCTIYGADVVPKVAINMHCRVIMSLLDEIRSHLSNDSIIHLIEFLTYRVIEGWWNNNSLNMKKDQEGNNESNLKESEKIGFNATDLLIKMFKVVPGFNKSIPHFIVACLSQTQSIDDLMKMGDAIINAPFFATLISNSSCNMFYDPVDNTFSSNSSNDKYLNCFVQSLLYLIATSEMISSTNPKAKEFLKLLSIKISNAEFKIALNSNDLSSWLLNNKACSECYLKYYSEIVSSATTNSSVVSSERLDITRKSRNQKIQTFMRTIVTQTTFLRRAFKYNLFIKINIQSILIESAINNLFKVKSLMKYSGSAPTKFCRIPASHPMVVPFKLAPKVFDYEATYTKTENKIETPKSVHTLHVKSNIKELNQTLQVIGPKCLEGWELPPHVPNESVVYNLFRKAFSISNNSSSSTNSVIFNPFTCDLLMSPEVLPCVGIISLANNTIHVLMGSKLTKSSSNKAGNNSITFDGIELIEYNNILLGHFPLIESALHGLYGDTSLFLGHAVINISFPMITLDILRTFAYQPNAIDIFTAYGCHFSFINLPSSVRKIIDSSISYVPVPNARRSFQFAQRLYSKSIETVTKMWNTQIISNFDYLLYLNMISGRSFNDYSQYPVFPWTISDYSSEFLLLSSTSTTTLNSNNNNNNNNNNNSKFNNNNNINSNSNNFSGANSFLLSTNITTSSLNRQNHHGAHTHKNNFDIYGSRYSSSMNSALKTTTTGSIMNTFSSSSIYSSSNSENTSSNQQTSLSPRDTSTSIFRDLAKPMGQLCKERSEHFDSMYSETDPHYFYGTHYSNPALVLSYLVRIEPITTFNVVFHGGFEHPDRLFFSIEETWRSCSETTPTDVRELIPEMYCFTNMFENVNKITIPERTDGLENDSVVLPKWANDDPYMFVHQMRNALESSNVSNNLSKWIDLIFGCKQKGPMAIEAKNVFHPLTYPQNLNRGTNDSSGNLMGENDIDENLKKAQIDTILNFGQCPQQVIKEQKITSRSMRPKNTLLNMDTKTYVLKKQNAQNCCRIRVYDDELILCEKFQHTLAVPPLNIFVSEGFITIKNKLCYSSDLIFDITNSCQSNDNTVLTIVNGCGIILNYYINIGNNNNSSINLSSSANIPNSGMRANFTVGGGGNRDSLKDKEGGSNSSGSMNINAQMSNNASKYAYSFTSAYSSTSNTNLNQPQLSRSSSFVNQTNNSGISKQQQQSQQSQQQQQSQAQQQSQLQLQQQQQQLIQQQLNLNACFVLISKSLLPGISFKNCAVSTHYSLVCASSQTGIYLFDLTSGFLLRQLETKDEVNLIEFDEVQDFIILTTISSSVIVLSLDFTEIAFANSDEYSEITSIALCDGIVWNSSPFFATGHEDGSILLWEIIEHKISTTLLTNLNGQKITSMKIVKCNRALIAIDEEGSTITVSIAMLMKKILKSFYYETCSVCHKNLLNPSSTTSPASSSSVSSASASLSQASNQQIQQQITLSSPFTTSNSSSISNNSAVFSYDDVKSSTSNFNNNNTVVTFCALCGLPMCPKCVGTEKPNLCKTCEASEESGMDYGIERSMSSFGENELRSDFDYFSGSPIMKRDHF